MIKRISPELTINRDRTTKTTGASRLREGVVYARVSSKEQEKEGFSIPAQLKLLRDYALGREHPRRRGVRRRGDR